MLVEAAERLERASLIALTPEVLDAAGDLEDPAVRSLDAIHVATALSIAEELQVFVTYDAREARAVRAAGLPLAQPGA